MSRRVLITGASGFVGNRLLPGLRSLGYDTASLVRRRPAGPKEFYWNPLHNIIDIKALEGVDAIINLSGSSISKRWTRKRRSEIISSRVGPAEFLAETIRRMDVPPGLLLSASAVGYYGFGGGEADEETPRGGGFLADVCGRWEEACRLAKEKGSRVVSARLGVVLGKEGGALEKMLPVFRMNLGGKLGGGLQPMSWVALGELPFVFDFIMRKVSLEGAVNVVSPGCVSNGEFTELLAKALHKKPFAGVPAFVLRAVYGRMAEELLLGGIRAKPSKLERSGYKFKYGDLYGFFSEELRRI